MTAHLRLICALCAVAVLAAMSMCTRAGAAVIYVDDSASGLGGGFSWSSAFRDLQKAIQSAQPGDEIRVGQGTYRPAGPGSPRISVFLIPNGVTLRGGYAGVGAPNPDANDPAVFVTTLTGDLNGDDGPNFANTNDNAYTVLRVNGSLAATLISGFHITAAKADSGGCDGSALEHGNGGGLLAVNANLQVSDCVFERNQAFCRGAGAFVTGGSLRFQRCAFVDNRMTNIATGTGVGGGLEGASNDCVIEDCQFIRNRAQNGGGAFFESPAVLRRCTFSGNHAGEFAGALDGGGFVAIDCDFDNNTATGGGAVAVFPLQVSTLINCRFTRNSGGNMFGGNAILGSVLAVNCLVAGNHGPTAAVITSSPPPGSPPASALIDCTIVGNMNNDPSPATAGVVASANTTIRDCLIWNNFNAASGTVQSQQIEAAQGVQIGNSTIQGWTGSLGGPNNSGADPLFIDADGPDNIYGTLDDNPRLGPDSPARDSGDNAALPPDTYDLDHDGNATEPLPYDLDTHRRIVNGTIDRGCYEFQTCPGDIAPLADQGDGRINVDDLLAVIVSWGACPSPCPADIVHNQRVDVDDLLAVILGWGACP